MLDISEGGGGRAALLAFLLDRAKTKWQVQARGIIRRLEKSRLQ